MDQQADAQGTSAEDDAMTPINIFKFSRFLVIALTIGFAGSAHAYIGPGAGLGVIGTLVAFVGAVLLAIVGFVWYPLKRLFRKRKQPAVEAKSEAVERKDAAASGGDGETVSH